MNLSRATSPSQQSRIVESWNRSAPMTPAAYPPTPKTTEARTPTAVARTVTPLGVNGVRSSHRVIHLEHRRLKCRSTKPSRPPLSERINVCSASAGPDVPSAQTSWNQSDRKSTRLNSSHLVISYAVFCLKKKKTQTPLKLRHS